MGLFARFRSAGRLRASAREGKTDAAERDALRLIDEGNAIEQQGQIAEALQCYDAAIRLAPNLARAHLNRGNALLAMGDADGALACYATALVKKPEYAAAHFNTGNAHLRAGRRSAAVAAYREALAVDSGFADAEVALGAALEGLGQPEDAIACYRRALAIRPDYAEVHFSLGTALKEVGQVGGAVASYRRAVALRDDFVEAHNNLGIALKESGQYEAAVASLTRALSLRPDSAEVHCNLGTALQALGQVDAAVASYRRAVALRDDFVEAHHHLGNVLRDIGQLDAAVASLTRAVALGPDDAEAHNNLGSALKELGQIDAAVASYRRAVALRDDFAEAHNNLGIALRDTGQLDAAVASLTRALAIKPDFALVHCNLGATLYGRGQLDEAAASFRHALAIEPGLPGAHNNLGMTLKELGQLEAAVACLSNALTINPEDAAVHSNLLFVHNYLADQPASHLLEAARRYGDLVVRQARPVPVWRNLPDPTRRLRVGFVSGDLRSHAAGHFAEAALGALASRHSDQLEIIAYPTHFTADAVTERIKGSCHGWHSAVGLSDERLAQRIRDDGIDILVDLSGHTAHNRLSMFAWKPAPVQATWIGYFATTGVAAIDYFIADPWTLPPSAEAHFTEKIWRLPETRFCFTVPDAGVEVGPLPALHNGYVTFGCFNHLSKMNDRVAGLWAEVLAAVPDSRLFLKSTQIGEASMRQEVVGRFAAHGIAAERLTLEGQTPLAEYLAAYRRVDIALDPFPYTGGATTVQALWMGVPVLTLAGERFVSRQGIGLLMNAGLPEWIAADTTDYVARAVSHAGDLQRLAAVRSGLRSRVLSSPVFDADRFADHFAAALRGMWQAWCLARQDRP